MRLRFAGLIASAQRSMSLKAARDNPQITAFLLRLAISCTAAKSPSEAIGKPASMISTPIWSRRSATSSFSSWVMVAPGHCSPSRKVVSKMRTRSFSEFAAVGILGVLGGRCRPHVGRRRGSLRFPLSARAQTPSRPSGDHKEQQPANNESGKGQRGQRSKAFPPPADRAQLAARLHHNALVINLSQGWQGAHSAIPPRRIPSRHLLAETPSFPQDVI